MARKVLLTSNKTDKQAKAVAKAREALRSEQAKYRDSQEEETNKAFINLGEKIVKHWKLSSIEDLKQWYSEIINRYPVNANKENQSISQDGNINDHQLNH